MMGYIDAVTVAVPRRVRGRRPAGGRRLPRRRRSRTRGPPGPAATSSSGTARSSPGGRRTVRPPSAVPDRRRPHRQPQPPAQAPAGHGPGGLAAAGGRGLRRRPLQLVARPGPRPVGSGDGPHRARRRGAPPRARRQGALRVPQLAIHLDREISSKGLKLNPQQHLTPVWGVGAVQEGDLRAVRGRRARHRRRRRPRLGPHGARPHAGVVPRSRTASCWRPLGSTTSAPASPRCGRCSTSPRPSSPRRRRLAGWRGPGRSRSASTTTRRSAATSATGADGVLLASVLERAVAGPRRRPGCLPPLDGRVGVRVGRHGPRHPPELPRAPRARPPDRGRTADR